MIIAFSGVKFAGKDTAAEALIRMCGFKRIGLADKLKDICSVVFEISRADMDNPQLKEKQFESSLVIKNEHLKNLRDILERDGFEIKDETLYNRFISKSITSIRDMLQIVGTDICRNCVKDDIWLKYIQDFIKTYDGNVVITDARFKNERDFLKSIGATLILIKRPGYESKSDHISENQLGADSDYDVVVTNDSTPFSMQSSIFMWYSLKHAAKSNHR